MVEPTYAEVGFKELQEDSPLHLLPREILDAILEYLDPLSMVRLSCTCALFYNIVNQAAKWRTWAIKIAENSRMPHLSSTFLHFGVSLKPVLPAHEDDSDILWRKIFYCMQFWSMIKKWNYRLTYETCVENDDITTVEIAGQDIVFGTCHGGLGLWNPDESEDLQVLHRFKCEVLTVLVRFSDKLPSYQIITKCKNRLICLYDLAENTAHHLRTSHVTGGISFSQNEDVFYEWDPDRGILFHMSIKNKSVTKLIQFPQLPFHPVVTVCGDGELQSPFDKAQVSTHVAVSRHKGPVVVKHFESLSGQISQRCDEILEDSNFCIYKAYIWPGKISFSITGSSLTILTVGYKFRKIRWPSCRCTSAFLFGNIFIVGTDTGTILCYTFKSPADLLNLEPENYRTKIETESSESLMYVGIRAQNEIHPFPDIVAATTSKLFCFRAFN
ncbi:F-box/WD repeat-containing protein 7 [Frankliniella fusca]|uniref:F-box/WD repeat-containing protein 7 n=1 Tax=Frankliniella fusca TaxID=407009 RepID=A0AAE1L6C7_9NEOP|nr:F-box/WD repeat-containing protein 7 [Frankliniella fusca]